MKILRRLVTTKVTLSCLPLYKRFVSVYEYSKALPDLVLGILTASGTLLKLILLFAQLMDLCLDKLNYTPILYVYVLHSSKSDILLKSRNCISTHQ